MLKRVFIFITTALFLSIGCQKDELTLPTSVDFAFEMVTFELKDDHEVTKQASTVLEADQDNNPLDNDPPFNGPHKFKSLEINISTIVITAMEIDGKREQGKDVFLNTNFDPPLEIKLEDGNISDHNISFDIPQGIYKKLDIWFYLGTDEKPAISFKGSATQEKSPGVGFNFKHSHKENVQVRARGNQTSDPIVLSKEKKGKAHVIVDAEYMFRNITFEQLAATKIINIPGGREIRIDKNNNKPLFAGISERLAKTITVVFE